MNCKKRLWSDTSNIGDFCRFRRNEFKSSVRSLPTISTFRICTVSSVHTSIPRETSNMKNDRTISIYIFYRRRPIRTHDILTSHQSGFVSGFLDDPTTILWKSQKARYRCLIESCRINNRFPVTSRRKCISWSTRTIQCVRCISYFPKYTQRK